MAQDNGLPSGMSISGLAVNISRSARLNTPRQREAMAARINRQVARQSGRSLADVESRNIGMRAVNERRRMGSN